MLKKACTFVHSLIHSFNNCVSTQYVPAPLLGLGDGGLNKTMRSLSQGASLLSWKAGQGWRQTSDRTISTGPAGNTEAPGLGIRSQ